MIPKSGYRFSEKIMLQQQPERDDDSKKSHHAVVPLFDLKFLRELAAAAAGSFKSAAPAGKKILPMGPAPQGGRYRRVRLPPPAAGTRRPPAAGCWPVAPGHPRPPARPPRTGWS